MWVGGQNHAPAALPPGKTRSPLYRRLGGPPGPVWKVVENLAATGIRSPDRPARSESLYRPSYPGPRDPWGFRIHLRGVLKCGRRWLRDRLQAFVDSISHTFILRMWFANYNNEGLQRCSGEVYSKITLTFGATYLWRVTTIGAADPRVLTMLVSVASGDLRTRQVVGS